MLLIVKGKATKTRCCECRSLYAPAESELKAASRRAAWAFICEPCRMEIERRSYGAIGKRRIS
jgi:hypothetical protein